MAAKKRIRKTREIKEVEPVMEQSVVEESVVSQESKPTAAKPWLIKAGIGAVVVLGVLALWWWKTDTWPVLAMVNGKPIWRMQVEKELYKQGGADLLESMITQELVKNELNNKGVIVNADEVKAKIEDIKKQLPEGTALEAELAKRGTSLGEMTKMIELQVMVSQYLTPRATVSAEEIEKYVKDNSKYMTGKTDAERRVEAEGVLKQDRLQAEISKWVAEVVKAGKVWRMNPKPVTAT